MADSISIGSLRAFNTDSCFPTAWHGPSDGTSLVIVRPVCAVDSRRSFMVAALGPCSLMNRIDQGKVVNPSPSATSLDLSKAVPLSVVLGRQKASPFTRQSHMSQADPSSHGDRGEAFRHIIHHVSGCILILSYS